MSVHDTNRPVRAFFSLTWFPRTKRSSSSDQPNQRLGTRRLLLAALAVTLGAPVIAILLHGLSSYSVLREFFDQLPHPFQLPRPAGAIMHISVGAGLVAGLLTGLSFAVLGCIEYLVVNGRMLESTGVPGTVAARAVFRTSLLANAVSHCIGGVATSLAIRVRLYTRHGKRISEIAMITARASSTIWAGGALAALAAAPLISTHDRRAITGQINSLAMIRWPGSSPFVVSALALVGISILVGLRRLLRARSRPSSARLTTSPATSAPAEIPAYNALAVRIPTQTLLASFDWLVCAMVLFVLFPHGSISIALCIVLFIAAHSVSALTHTPAGLGAFDVIVFAVASPLAGTVATLTALVWYRAIYYGLPMTLAAITLIRPEGSLRVIKRFSPNPARKRSRSRIMTVSLHRDRARVLPAPIPSPASSGTRGSRPSRALLAPLVAAAPSTTAHLALVGDKKILYHETGSAFLMYGVSGRSWVALGEPVGRPAEQADLVQRFFALVTAHRGRAVFYHVPPAALQLYDGMGLQQRKIGECARVALAGFSLDGQSRRWLRRARKSLIASGCTVDFVDQNDVPPLLPALRDVSDSWLRDKRSREKCFSLGYFDPDYLRHCPMAIVKRHDQVIAFANIWTSGGSEEASVDLMRYAPGAPHGVIDYLLSEIMLWARKRGFAWFDLGVAPLAGVTGGRGAPAWNRIAEWVFRRGNWLYGFEGLQRYKAKYDPEWEARYILLPIGASMAVVAKDVARLIGGGARRTAAREAA